VLTRTSAKSTLLVPISVEALTCAASIAAVPAAVWSPNGLIAPFQMPSWRISSST